jgi:Tfp pilus assembly protein PilN
VIRTNLATRPFYNERAVHIALLGAAAVLIGATIFNVSRIMTYSTSNTELVSAASRDEQQAAELHRTASQLRASVDPRQIEAASIQAREANDLIDRRTFSWTELFNRFETTLPPEVRITAVRPSIDRERRIVLTITVLARGVDDVNQFMENLDDTRAFVELISQQERVNDEGQLESTLQTVYVRHPAAPPSASRAGDASDARREGR